MKFKFSLKHFIIFIAYFTITTAIAIKAYEMGQANPDWIWENFKSSDAIKKCGPYLDRDWHTKWEMNREK